MENLVDTPARSTRARFGWAVVAVAVLLPMLVGVGRANADDPYRHTTFPACGPGVADTPLDNANNLSRTCVGSRLGGYGTPAVPSSITFNQPFSVDWEAAHYPPVYPAVPGKGYVGLWDVDVNIWEPEGDGYYHPFDRTDSGITFEYYLHPGVLSCGPLMQGTPCEAMIAFDGSSTLPAGLVVQMTVVARDAGCDTDPPGGWPEGQEPCVTGLPWLNVVLPLGGAQSPPPVASLAATPSGTVTGKFSFDASGSTVTGGGAFDHFTFDFGDGTSTTTPGATPTATHTYSGDLEPTVTLTAVDANGGSDTDTLTLSPSLTIDQIERDPDPPTPGEPLTLHVTVTNGGASTLHGVDVTAAFTPEDVASQSGPSLPAAPDLGAARTTVLDVPVDLVGDDPAAEAHVDASATSSTGATIDAATRDLSLKLGTGLRVRLDAELDGSLSDRRFNVEATVTNATGEVLHDVAPVGLVSDPEGAASVGAASPASVATLEIGQSTTFTWTVTLTGSNHAAELEATVRGTDSDDTDWTGTATTAVSDTITVNDHGDDANDEDALDDGRCDVAPELDGDQCTLRAAIQLVNSLDLTGDPFVRNVDAPPITIGFDLAGSPRITPAEPYVTIDHPIVLDGTTQAGGFVELHGNGSGDGLRISGTASVVRGMVVNGFDTGILLLARSATVVGNRIGTDVAGTTAIPNDVGIEVSDSRATTNDYQIGGTAGTSVGACTGDCNLIAGNGTDVQGEGDLGDECRFSLQGSWIGLDATGTRRLSNGYAIFTRCERADRVAVRIGGPTSIPGTAPGNRIASAGGIVLQVIDPGADVTDTSEMVVEGNTVGLDATGTRSAGAANTGIAVSTGNLPSEHVKIGTAGGGNVVSGATTGIRVESGSVAINSNRIGTDVSGTAAVPNGTGVFDRGDGIADELVLRDNLISGNAVGLEGRVLHLVKGNRVGVAADGVTPLPNGVGLHGVGEVHAPPPSGSYQHPEPSIVLGQAGGCSGPCNVISGNTGAAVQLDTEGGTFESYASYIGVGADGTTVVPNGKGVVLGVVPGVDEPAFVIGGPSTAFAAGRCSGPCNIVAGNHGVGIDVEAAPGQAGDAVNVIAGNLVGRTDDGSAHPNDDAAIRIVGSGLNPTLIGGDAARGNRITASGGEHAAVAVAGEAGPAPVAIVSNRFDGAVAADVIQHQGDPDPVTLTDWKTADGVVHVTGYADAIGAGGDVELYAGAACGGDLVPVASGPLTALGGVAVDVAPAMLVGRPYLTALHTDGQDRTSELSTCLAGPAATFTTEAGIVGMTEIDVTSNDGFAAGDVVEGPGGEQHTVAGIGSLIFAEPLQTAWPVHSVVVQVTPSSGQPTTTTTPVVSGSSDLRRTGSDLGELAALGAASALAGALVCLAARRRRRGVQA